MIILLSGLTKILLTVSNNNFNLGLLLKFIILLSSVFKKPDVICDNLTIFVNATCAVIT